jgi:hypothetical protein
MKKILFLLATLLILSSCEDFLDTKSKTKKDTGNYPGTAYEASQLLTGVYSILGRPEPLGSSFMTSELMSDDRLGGGGENDLSCKAIDRFQKSSENMFDNPWRAHYFGVFRSNFLISALDNVEWKSEEERNPIEGEAHFLRAHFYFDLSRMFGEVPLVTSPEYENIPKAPAEETYALIASDLKTAIEKLAPVKFQDIDRATDLGRINRWAAEAMMARVFLFYTGYYQKETLPLREGGEITRQQVIEWLTDCIENSGHDLVPDFRNLWPYSYVQDYNYTKNNGLEWERDGNIETVFAVKYSTIGYNFDYPQQKSNQFCLYFGLRNQPNSFQYAFPYGQGWGMGTVNPLIWNEWDDSDPRKRGSILDANDRTEMRIYVKGGNSQMDETMYYQKKYMPVNVWKDANNLQNYSYELYTMGANTDYMSNNTQDLVLIRFADVLLMHAELTGGAIIGKYSTNGLNQVRRRAGLTDAAWSLENLKKERRFELAFEGVRYYDLLRWHDWNVLTDNQTDIPVYNISKLETTSITFRPETGGFLPIPQNQIDLQDGVLTQNAGWEGTANYYSK